MCKWYGKKLYILYNLLTHSLTHAHTREICIFYLHQVRNAACPSSAPPPLHTRTHTHTHTNGILFFGMGSCILSETSITKGHVKVLVHYSMIHTRTSLIVYTNNVTSVLPKSNAGSSRLMLYVFVIFIYLLLEYGSPARLQNFVLIRMMSHVYFGGVTRNKCHNPTEIRVTSTC